jgi:hypothetical protein
MGDCPRRVKTSSDSKRTSASLNSRRRQVTDEITLLYVIIAVESTLLVGSIAVLRFVIWPLYIKTRDDCADMAAQLEAAKIGRDGWREATERLLVVAGNSREVTERATQLATNMVNGTGR